MTIRLVSGTFRDRNAKTTSRERERDTLWLVLIRPRKALAEMLCFVPLSNNHTPGRPAADVALNLRCTQNDTSVVSKCRSFEGHAMA